MEELKVLVVDDEEIICESIKADFGRMTSLCSYEVFMANSVAEAEEIYDREKPEILITDINMPGGSGLILVEKIRKTNPDCGILVLSAYDDFNYVRNAFTMGADDYVLKPIAFSELQNQVKKLTEKVIKAAKKADTSDVSVEKSTENTVYDMEAILKYIKEHAGEKLSAAEMAKKLAVSYNSFGKLFKEHTEMSFSSYVLLVRMELAKEYLANPAIKIKQVASKVGYKDNPQHFSRDFTRQTGVSPKEYRGKVLGNGQ